MCILDNVRSKEIIPKALKTIPRSAYISHDSKESKAPIYGKLSWGKVVLVFW